MKVWELKEGVEYIAYDKNFGKRNYKIVDGEFLYFDDNERWSLSLRKYKELNELDFTEYTPPTDWSKVEVDTKVLVKDKGNNNHWCKCHFSRYINNEPNCEEIRVFSNGTTSYTSTERYLLSEVVCSPSDVKLYTE